MNGLMAWMEKYILPTAAKIGAQKHLVALRDAFIGTLPATMAGSVAVMINAIIRDLPQEFVSTYAASLEADKGIFAVLNVIIGINGFVWNGTLAIAGLIFAFSWGYNLAKAYNVNELAGGIVSLATLISGVAFAPNNTAELAVKVPEKIANAINGAEIGASIANNQLTVNPWGQAQLINIDIFQKGYEGKTGTAAVLAAIDDGKAYMWVRGSFDAFAWFGGSGGTIVLIIAILLFSKRADYLTVGKLSLGPGIFNINEPIMFGLPVVLNPIMFIPFVIAPLVATTIGWVATYLGLVAPVSQQVAWVTPPLLLSFLATGADWRAPIVALVCMVVTFLIWTPFVIAANKMDPALGESEQ